MKICSIIGARPQFIKSAPVSSAMRAAGSIREVLIHTGQHYDNNMSDVFFEELGISPPDYHLGVGSGSHGTQTGRMLEAIEGVLVGEVPDWVLVYGDTNSTLAGALAAAKLQIPVAHVEAGLRSFNRRMPEELNRVLTDHLSEMLLAPTTTAAANLGREGIKDSKVWLVGDVMYDAAMLYGNLARQRSTILTVLGLRPQSYILVTIHRAENTDDTKRLEAIAKGLLRIGREWPVVFPLHPRTRGALERAGLLGELKLRMQVIDPVGYLDMVMLEMQAALVVTDSGGVQKEAFFYQVPCVTLREETEWVELVELGWNRLAPPVLGTGLAPAILAALDTSGVPAQPFGDGHAAKKIADLLASAQ